jgi:hypothetical protein
MDLRDRWRSPEAQRRAGRLMIGLGAVGVVVALFGMIVGWIFVGQLADASDDSLEVTVQTTTRSTWQKRCWCRRSMPWAPWRGR